MIPADQALARLREGNRRALVQRILKAPKVTLEHAELICYLQWAIEAVDGARRDEIKE